MFVSGTQTKSQVLAQQQSKTLGQACIPITGNGAMASVAVLEQPRSVQPSMLQLIEMIYRMEGIGGFFGGVQGMMVGQGKFHGLAKDWKSMGSWVVLI